MAKSKTVTVTLPAEIKMNIAGKQETFDISGWESHILEYACMYKFGGLKDSYANCKTDTERRAAFKAKLEKLASGKFKPGTGGGRGAAVSETVTEGLRIVARLTGQTQKWVDTQLRAIRSGKQTEAATLKSAATLIAARKAKTKNPNKAQVAAAHKALEKWIADAIQGPSLDDMDAASEVVENN